MKHCILALALAAPACGPVVSPGQIAQADSRLTQVEQSYAAARAFADLFAPMLSPARQAQIAAAEAAVERMLSAARLAVTVADRAAAIEQASAALTQFRFVSGN